MTGTEQETGIKHQIARNLIAGKFKKSPESISGLSMKF